MIFGWDRWPSSSPAKAGDPVTTRLSVITGCPAFAGHDSGGASDSIESHHALKYAKRLEPNIAYVRSKR
jgi:hypothetical protein